MTEPVNPETALKMATDIVIAYLGHGSVPPEELPDLVRKVRAALLEELTSTADSAPPTRVEAAAEPGRPSVTVEESVTPDWIVCLEDGGRFKSLRRHLKAKYNLTPEEYRRKWGLPDDYPMVAPNYSKVRSKLARELGFNNRAQTEAGAGKPGRGKAG